jgi:ZIP family zinc transporter
VLEILLASAGAGLIVGPLGTGAGAVAVVALRRVTPAALNGLLGFAAGMMLAAVLFGLLLPALDLAREPAGGGATPLPAVLHVIAGLACGALAMVVAHVAIPHTHAAKGDEGPRSAAMSRLMLLVVAIALHNAPEGIAAGVAAATRDPEVADSLVAGIAIQNMPEGLAVAVAMLAGGATRLRAVLVAVATGCVELVCAILAGLAVALSASLLPYALAFAAGAMLFVIANEVIPEIHRSGHDRYASGALIAGFSLMMLIDAAL